MWDDDAEFKAVKHVQVPVVASLPEPDTHYCALCKQHIEQNGGDDT